MGIQIKTSVKVGKDISLSQLKEENDAILITTGSKNATRLATPRIDLQGVIDGYQFLENVFIDGIDNYLKITAQKYYLGKDDVVIGGGDTALDCARTALRLTQGIPP